jgi:hypothetical protein
LRLKTQLKSLVTRTQPPLPHVARTPVGLEKPNGANGQMAAVTTRAAGSPSTEPANEAASVASPAFDPKSPGGVSNSTTPTTAEAAQRLATFTNEVQIKRRSPLIRSPPKQKLPAKTPLSRWGTSRHPRGVRSYSKKKMGFAQQLAPPPASHHSFDSLFDSNVSASHVAAFDELFPAAKTPCTNTSAPFLGLQL